MIDEKLLNMLMCPVCKSGLVANDEKLRCSNNSCNKEYAVFEGIPVMLRHSKSSDKNIKFTKAKWEKAYREYGHEYYSPDNVPKSICVCSSYIKRFMSSTAKTFMEAGCGTARSSLDTSLKYPNLTVVCLDYTVGSLLIAKKLFEKNNAKGFFVCGDIKDLPFKEGVFDFIFSDGAIEHFKETQKAVDEFYRVLRNHGRVFATVPYISIPMFTHGQLHGNVPNVPILKPFFEFFHMRLMGGVLMKNGYELSFTKRRLKGFFRKYSQVDVGPFHAFQEMKWLKVRMFRKMIRRLLKNQLFWYMIYGYGVKSE